MISGGLTKKLQLLDISTNGSFKTKLRKHWDNGIINGNKEYTKGGNKKRTSYKENCS